MMDLFAGTEWLQFKKKSVSMHGFSIHSIVYSVVGVWSPLSVQEGNASFMVRMLQSELYMVIYII